MEERLMWRWMWINKLTRLMGSCQKFIHLGFPNFSFRLNLWERIAKKWSHLYLIWSPNSGSRGWVKIWKCTFQLWGVHAGDGIVFQIQGTFRQFSIFFKAIGQKVPAIRNNCSFTRIGCTLAAMAAPLGRGSKYQRSKYQCSKYQWIKIPTDPIKIPTDPIKIPTDPIKIPTSTIKIPITPFQNTNGESS